MHRHDPVNAEKPVRVGVFDTVWQAEEAVGRLLSAGFGKDQLSVISSDPSKREAFDDLAEKPAGSRTFKAAATGGALGAALGGATALAGLLTAGGAGIIAAGALALTGTVSGGFIGAMMTRGLEKEAADYYDQAVTEGKVLVAVEEHGQGAAERLARAETILEEAGAEPIPLSSG
jgi:hypothetical protein